MLGTKRRTQRDKVRAAVREAVTYIDEVANDKRLRADVRSAMNHGDEARSRIRKDVTGDSIATRLANDRKLRKKVHAMLDDLESAGDRLRRKERHRLRNALLVLGSIGVVAAAVPSVRRWITGHSARTDATIDVTTL